VGDILARHPLVARPRGDTWMARADAMNDLSVRGASATN
jgi:hypothetical protein